MILLGPIQTDLGPGAGGAKDRRDGVIDAQTIGEKRAAQPECCGKLQCLAPVRIQQYVATRPRHAGGAERNGVGKEPFHDRPTKFRLGLQSRTNVAVTAAQVTGGG